MKQFYLLFLCLAFIVGGGNSATASGTSDSTANRRYVGKLDSIQKINEVEKKELTSTVFEDFNEQYQYLIGLALALLLLEFAMLERRSRLLARFNIFRKR
jgi:Ca-activated chloride channel family protein